MRQRIECADTPAEQRGSARRPEECGEGREGPGEGQRQRQRHEQRRPVAPHQRQSPRPAADQQCQQRDECQRPEKVQRQPAPERRAISGERGDRERIEFDAEVAVVARDARGRRGQRQREIAAGCGVGGDRDCGRMVGQRAIDGEGADRLPRDEQRDRHHTAFGERLRAYGHARARHPGPTGERHERRLIVLVRPAVGVVGEVFVAVDVRQQQEIERAARVEQQRRARPERAERQQGGEEERQAVP